MMEEKGRFLLLTMAWVIGMLFLTPLGPGVGRSADAEEAPAPAASSEYAGSETCQVCHGKQHATFSATTMGKLFLKHPRNEKEKLGCEACHGPGKRHAESSGESYEGLITFSKKDLTPVERRNGVCLGCHQKAARLHWLGSAHESRGLACTACHQVMENRSPRYQLAQPTEIDTCGQCHLQRKAQQMRYSHMPLREGKMTCSSCHNPHGTPARGLLKANSVNELCYTCHAEKRGPFLYEHPPAMENCANCHEPHGSNHESMLIVSKPRLCQKCHLETRHPTRPNSSPATRFVFNRSCTNCHNEVHGSNHPSGRAYQR